MSDSARGSEPGMQVASPECRQVLGTDSAPRRLSFPPELVFAAPAFADAGTPSPPAPGGEPREGPHEKVAVLVCHGMGQQVPFEHIDMIAGAIRRAAELPPEHKTRVKFATLGDQRLPRAEIDLVVGGKRRRVDVYEAYWAPLTEGKVSAFAVTRFLFDAGFRGIEYALRGHFDRWMMGDWHRLSLRPGTSLLLVLAFAVVCSGLLVYGALGFVLLALAGRFLFGPGAFSGQVLTLTDTLFLDLARSPLLLGLAVLPAFAALWAWRAAWWPLDLLRSKWEAAWKERSRPAALAALGLVGVAALSGVARWTPVGAWIAGHPGPAAVLAASALLFLVHPWGKMLVSTAAALAVMAWTITAGVAIAADAALVDFPGSGLLDAARTRLLSGLGSALPWITDAAAPLFPVAEPGPSFSPAFQVFFLASAVVVCLAVRSFYIQFLGDVAVYLSSHKLNEFDELRTQIRKIGRDVGCAIYGARGDDPRTPEYDGVVVVGHSLGSVVAYDTLNDVLNHDMTLTEQLVGRAAGPGKRVLQAERRTLRLITFGSPLDKSAFIFRTQMKKSQIREGLAAAVQPLIEREGGKRMIQWTNIYSPMDPISGRVDFYDPPLPEKPRRGAPADPHRVDNQRDPQASIFGQAHTAYWRSDKLKDLLYASVTAELPVRAT